MALKKFTKPGISQANPTVSIWGKGQIGFNRPTVEQNGLTEFKKVVMYYDDETAQMVFQFTNEEQAEGAVKLSLSKHNVGLISAKPYLDLFKIPYDVSRKFPTHFDQENKMIVVNLSEGTTVVPKRKSSKNKGSEAGTVATPNTAEAAPIPEAAPAAVTPPPTPNVAPTVAPETRTTKVA